MIVGVRVNGQRYTAEVDKKGFAELYQDEVWISRGRWDGHHLEVLLAIELTIALERALRRSSKA